MSRFFGILTSVILFFSSGCVFAEKTLPLYLLELPKGFSISIYADQIVDARSMTLGDKGTLFVGTRNEGKVYAVIPDETNPHKNKVITLASHLKLPNGVAFDKGSLYVAEMNRVLRYDDIESHLYNPPEPVVVSTALPTENHHGWRYIKFGPDEKLYISVGAPCNNCLRQDPHFATIMRMNKDGSDLEVFAKGVRNSLGFDWNPVTNALWFTDNSRDWMGDDLPPEKLNTAPKIGLNFGFPYCYGNNIPDPDNGKKFPCTAFVPPVFEMPAHVAPLGMLFYKGKMFPREYKNQIFIAEHGSWSRSSKVGYQVISVQNKNNKWVEEPFVSGWMQNENVWGRPVDLLELPDGSLLISDDFANVIYQVVYNSTKQKAYNHNSQTGISE